MSAPRAGRLDDDLRRTAWRIGLQTAGLLMACLLVVGAVLYVSVARSQDQQLTRSLTAAASTAGYGRDDHDRDNDVRQPRGGVATAVLDERGVLSPGSMPAGLPLAGVMRQVQASGGTNQRTVHLANGPFEVLTQRRGDDVVQVAASRFELHQERERILGALGLAGGTGLVLATLAAAVLARRAVRPMAEALEQQRRFVADAGHELRTPLTLLSTRAQLLARRVRDTRTPAEQQAALVERDASALVSDAGALVAILEDLLTAADARTPVPQEPVDLGAVVRACVAAAKPAAEEAGLVLAIAAPDAPTVVRGASTALGRAVSALVDNAVDHARSRVDVRVVREGRDVVVEVVDDGPGVARETLPRMFDRFASDRREAAPTGRRHFGLGLALVSEIAVRHGGRVGAANRPPPAQGAVLRLTLPAEAGRPGPAGAVTPPGSGSMDPAEIPESVPTPGARDA
ncbi:sensor histidine kinase [Microlunatus flavus]|uniref:histidine kinase n=1 Tax=Microlunatus flavus TaxID=1036181 RepID=A0A1H9K9W2_9ACTN|nr:HAMP domain-containing sensor histidine kinase [Microlunatus flavus]SEQ95909.1 Signal transduction histidine kinase [Microlunatus flavus]